MANVEDLLAKSKAKLAARNKSPKKVTISGPQRPWQENLAQYQKTDETLPSPALPTKSMSGNSQVSGNAQESFKVPDSGEELMSSAPSVSSDLPASCQSQGTRIGKEKGETSLPCKEQESCGVHASGESQAVYNSQEACSMQDTRKMQVHSFLELQRLSRQETLAQYQKTDETLPSPSLSKSMSLRSQVSGKSQEYTDLKESGSAQVSGELHLSDLNEPCPRQDAGKSMVSGQLQESGNTQPYSKSQESKVSQDTGVTPGPGNRQEYGSTQESRSVPDTNKIEVSSVSPACVKLQESRKSQDNCILQESGNTQASSVSQLLRDLQGSSLKQDSGILPVPGASSRLDGLQAPYQLQESSLSPDAGKMQVTDALQESGYMQVSVESQESHVLQDAGENPATGDEQESGSAQVSRESYSEPDSCKMQVSGLSGYGNLQVPGKLQEHTVLQEPGVKQESCSALGAGETLANKSSISDGSSNTPLTDKGLTTPADLFSITTGCACVPNRLLDFAFSVRSNLSLSELRLLLYFIRQTIGFKRTTIEVSTDEIVATTGLDRSKLHKFVGALEGRGLLIRHRGRGVANRYELPLTLDEKE